MINNCESITIRLLYLHNRHSGREKWLKIELWIIPRSHVVQSVVCFPILSYHAVVIFFSSISVLPIIRVFSKKNIYKVHSSWVNERMRKDTLEETVLLTKLLESAIHMWKKTISVLVSFWSILITHKLKL